jgi:hypothetical protein
MRGIVITLKSRNPPYQKDIGDMEDCKHSMEVYVNMVDRRLEE